MDGITRQQVSDFCQSFARGVHYVQKRFGTLPDHIILSDLDARTPRYNIDRKAIIVPYRFIAICIKLGTLRQSKTEPLLLPWHEMAIMYGVEEAYHHYDISMHYQGANRPMVAQPGDSSYDNTPLEKAAKVAVHEALADFHLLGRPIATVKVEAEDAAWFDHARHLNQSWSKRISDRVHPARLIS